MRCSPSTAPRDDAGRKLPPMLALSEAWSVSISLIVVFGIVFPALVTGLIAFAVAQGLAERRENLRRRSGHDT
jgi:hypothetical protein